MTRKPVLLFIIDALSSRIVLPAMDEGKLPMFAKLAQHGLLHQECHSVFPSITPAATAALVTGAYPAESQIAGASWYDDQNDVYTYYGSDIRAIMEIGFGEFLQGFLTRLNHERLSCSTMYQRCHELGLRSANVNLMWFHGSHAHKVELPWLLELLSLGKLERQVIGPDVLCLGDFVRNACDTKIDWPKSQEGLMKSYGFNDALTRKVVKTLFEQQQLCDLNVFYFPDNDFDSHKQGPQQAVSTIQQTDQFLQRLVESVGSLEEFLDQYAVVIVGDHSQTDMQHPPIELLKVAKQSGYQAGSLLENDRLDVSFCPNLRAAAVYFNTPELDRTEFFAAILQDERIDQVILPVDDFGTCRVMTKDRGVLSFWPEDAGVVDDFGGQWAYEGDLSAVDATLTENRIEFGTYPNAFERIHCCFTRSGGDAWLTAKPGYEFQVNEMATHTGGSHGSLHKDDSTTMLITCGIDCLNMPDVPRIIDVAPMIMSHLGDMSAASRIGASMQKPAQRPAKVPVK